LTTTNPIRALAFNRRNQLSLESTVETIESNFEKSWVENNIIANSVKHSSFDWVCGTLRGLQATTGQFKKGSAVISVPIGETLSSSDAGEQGCPSGLEEVWKELKATSRVSLLLLEQWSKSKEKGKSKFSSYIEALPAPGSLGTPFHWTDECLDTFPYTPLVTSVKLQRQKWVELYSKIENSGSFKGISYERFVWAMEIVRSRAFTGVSIITAITVIILIVVVAVYNCYCYFSHSLMYVITSISTVIVTAITIFIIIITVIIDRCWEQK
jgi:hypothetical protein